MKPVLFGWRYAVVCSFLAGVPLYAACGGAGTGTSTDPVDPAEYAIEFPTMYSAYAEGHDFKVPARIPGVKNIKWSCDPEGAVEFEKGTKTGETTIVVKKAGIDTVTIIAKIGATKTTAELHVTQSSAEVWSEGDQRYNHGTVFSWGGDGKGGGGGGGDGEGHHDHDGGHRDHKVDPKLSCTNCHGSGAGDDGDVKHTPTQTGGYSDDDIKKIITQATKPDGVEQRVMPLDRWQKIHKWEMDDQQLLGIITYLRSLEPESQGAVDFPGMNKLGKDHSKDKDKKAGSDKGSSGSTPSK